MSRILLIAGTHGDESIGFEIIDQMKSRDGFDFIVGNPNAVENAKRFIDIDLNRVFPGSQSSPLYEERRAWEIFEKCKSYEYIFDIHEAEKSPVNFVILPQKYDSSKNYDFLNSIYIDKIVFWPSVSGRKTGPIGQFMDNCIELELGTKNSDRPKVVEEGVKIISDFISVKLGVGESWQKKEKQFYEVYGKLNKEDLPDGRQLNDFEETCLGEESFFPLLVGQYAANEIVCYKMKLLNQIF